MIKLKITVLLLLLMGNTDLLACFCDLQPEFKTKEDLAEYQFIAHVKITGISTAKGIKPDDFVHYMVFQIKELYKGEERDTILVYGSHPSLMGSTSCDLGEKIGEEWIVFGSYNELRKQTMTDRCQLTAKIKSVDGYERLRYPLRATTKKKLQAIFDKKHHVTIEDGPRVLYYPNGNKQVEETYLQNKLIGKRSLWYPDGTLEGVQYYSNGVKNGTFRWYSRKGNLLMIEKFKDDVPSDTTIRWSEIDTIGFRLKSTSDVNKISFDSAKVLLSSNRIINKVIYDDDGNPISRTTYNLNGYKQIEMLYSMKGRKVVIQYFHSNGVRRSKQTVVDYIDTGIYQEWDENGRLSKSWEWDEHGKVKKETVKYY